MLALRTDDLRSDSSFEWPGAPHAHDLKPRGFMEHRWGNRHAANLPVSFTLQSGQRGVGRVLNISTTGAYVQTEIPLRILTLIDLLIDGIIPRGVRFTGCVMRRDQGGVGLEWEARIPSDLMRIVPLYPPDPPDPRKENTNARTPN
jgi:hypothetical protein